jgi:hypothetical protein
MCTDQSVQKILGEFRAVKTLGIILTISKYYKPTAAVKDDLRFGDKAQVAGRRLSTKGGARET